LTESDKPIAESNTTSNGSASIENADSIAAN